ncbi:MAG: papain-like cysteine protease family protein [Myxococcota bacterium]
MKSVARALGVALSVASLVMTTAPSALAGERCDVDRAGDETCVVGIPSERLEPVTAQQRMSQWCWAASIAMIFRFHGHPVAQERIVEATYGRIANLPAMDGPTMTEALTRPWHDARGQAFHADVRVFDTSSGRDEIDSQDVIDELRAERPLLVGTVGHAMVVTAMRYRKTPSGPEVLGVTVRDPWPGAGRRELDWSEMSPTYVAAVSFGGPARSEAARPSARPAGPSCGAQCAQLEAACVEQAPTVAACVAEQAADCVTTCIDDWGYAPAACRGSICAPDANAWEGQCERTRAWSVGACAEAAEGCAARCD